MSKRISGKDFHINILGFLVHVESSSLTVNDGRVAVTTHGVPDGHVDGDASAGGDIEVDTQNFNLIVEAAKKAGSFKDLPTFDMQYYAKTDEKLQVDAFGCLLKVEDLLDIDPNGTEKQKHKLSYVVTDSDFVHINGVPYLSASEVEGITG